MEIVADVHVETYGILRGVVFPIRISELQMEHGIAGFSDEHFTIACDEHNLFSEGDSIKLANAFAELVSKHDEDIVLSVSEVLGYKARDFVRDQFSFDGCQLLPDVETNKELGQYYFEFLGPECIDKEMFYKYFDFEGYGKEVDKDNIGSFSKRGYLVIDG